MYSGSADTEGFAHDVQHIIAYLYTDDGFLALTRVTCLQRAFTTLADIFVRVGLCKIYSQDGEHGLSSLPRAGGSLYGGLRPQDYGGGEHLPRVTLEAVLGRGGPGRSEGHPPHPPDEPST